MNRRIHQRTYPGQIHTPSVEIESFENENLILATIPWGSRDVSKTASRALRDFMSSTINDLEITSPFTKLPGLSPTANSIRIGTLVANDAIYQKFNKDHYTSACEILCLAFNNDELNWIQVGQPHLLLFRAGQFHTLSFSPDLSFDYELETPLPGRLLGVSNHIELESKSLKLKEGDKVVLISRTTIPETIFSKKFSNLNSGEEILEKLFDFTAKAQTEKAFVIAVIE